MALSCKNIIGCSMAFHASMKPRVAALRMAGRPRGSPTDTKQRKGPAPSSAAASSRLSGTASNPFLMMNTGKVENTPGRMTARGVSIRPSLSSTR